MYLIQSAFLTNLVGVSRPGQVQFEEILDAINDNTPLVAFNTTAKLRYTTGHNLVWDDVFSTPENYSRLFYQEGNALLYLISRKFAHQG
jgi:hypothetical protein